MKLFKKSSSKKFSKAGRTDGSRLSQKPVADWEQEQVRKWLAHLGMSKYEESFKAVSGRRLLQLEAADLYQLVNTKLDADLLLDALADLKEMQANPATPSRFSLSIKRSSNSTSGKPPLASSTVPAKSASGNLSVRTASDRGSSLASSGGNNSPAANNSPAGTPAANSPHTNGQDSAAAALAPHVGGSEVVSELYGYMNLLGIQGIGLVEATQRAPIIGHIIGALWEGHDLVRHAMGNRTNCLQLGSYGQDILRVFDAEGKRLAFIDGSALTQLLQHIETGNALLDSCCKPGWLLRMATNERSMEEFQAVHNIILETLRSEKVDTLPNGRQLTYGEYRDVGRPLRRMLKQLGSGSLHKGLDHLRASGSLDSVREIAQLIHVEPAAIMLDLQQRAHQNGGTDAAQAGDSNGLVMTEARKRECETIFHQYDKNHSQALEFEELRSVLGDLGMLDGVKPIDIDAATAAHFERADGDGDGRITFADFLAFYSTLATSSACQELRSAFGPQAERDLKKIFCSFASFGSRQQLEELDGAKFSKLCRDCKLLGRNLDTIDVDLIFASSKPKGARKVDFDQFLTALSKIAEKKGQSLAEVVRGVLLAGGPTVNSTKASYIKFHDDKSTYTGVHAHGGPTTVDSSKELSALLDRSESDVRGVKKTGPGSPAPPLAGRTGSGTSPSPLPAGAGGNLRGSSSPAAKASPGISPEGSSLGGSFSGSPATTPTARNPGASPFGPSPTPSPGPSSGAVSPSPPPSAGGRAGGVRASTGGLNMHRLALSSTASDAADKSPAPTGRSSSRENDSRSANKPAKGQVAPLEWGNEESLRQEVQEAFAAFAQYGTGSSPAGASRHGAGELDGARFAKLCRDSGLLGGRLNSTAVDLVFSKVKPKGGRKIGWAEFEKALSLLAEERRTEPLAVARSVAACRGPRHNATTSSVRVRLHDDKSTYTGVYAAGGPSTVDTRLTMESLISREDTSGAARRLAH